MPSMFVTSVFRWKAGCHVTLPTEASEKARGAGYLRRGGLGRLLQGCLSLEGGCPEKVYGPVGFRKVSH